MSREYAWASIEPVGQGSWRWRITLYVHVPGSLRPREPIQDPHWVPPGIDVIQYVKTVWGKDHAIRKAQRMIENRDRAMAIQRKEDAYRKDQTIEIGKERT